MACAGIAATWNGNGEVVAVRPEAAAKGGAERFAHGIRIQRVGDGKAWWAYSPRNWRPRHLLARTMTARWAAGQATGPPRPASGAGVLAIGPAMT
ncbi:MAG: hypothetical protein U0837_08645 [Dehalococcoidia bacterium]